MPKHRAEFQLTDQNWDQEEEPEERGEFAKATEDVLKQRKIKKAIRNTNTSSGGSGAFSGFGGFGGLGGTSLFNKPDTNGSSVPAAGSVSAAVKKFENPPADKREEVNGVNKKGDNSGYLKQLKALNEGVLSWIKQHVDKNPYCLLTPIFGDYEKHLSDIEKKYPKKAGSQTDVNKKEDSADKAATSPDKIAAVKTDSVLSSSEATSSSNTCQTSTFPTFSFATVTKSEFKPSFSFGASVVNSASSAQAAADGEADEEYVPPKAEVKEIKEEGAVYTKRCKLFYQKEGAWADKGVGNLHLKELEGKSQLLVRADTNLGNILLNILITKALPTARQGKNNVSLVCVPNPPIDPKKEGDKTPVPMLIRVKTGDDADELLEKINEMKK